MHNKTSKLKLPALSESLSFKDLDGLMKPTIHVDEFSSKMGDDDDIIVVSFFLRDQQAAKDLMNWFEKGYDFVVDADRSPGEIKPNRYLVYVELRRRSTAGGHVEQLLNDLNTLTEFVLEEPTAFTNIISLLTLIKSPLKMEVIPLNPNIVLPIPTEEDNVVVTAVETNGDCMMPFKVIKALVFVFLDLKIWVLPVPTEVNDRGIGLKSSAFCAEDASCTFSVSILIT